MNSVFVVVWIDLSKKLDLIFKLEDLSSPCLKVASQIRVLRGRMRVWRGWIVAFDVVWVRSLKKMGFDLQRWKVWLSTLENCFLKQFPDLSMRVFRAGRVFIFPNLLNVRLGWLARVPKASHLFISNSSKLAPTRLSKEWVQVELPESTPTWMSFNFVGCDGVRLAWFMHLWNLWYTDTSKWVSCRIWYFSFYMYNPCLYGLYGASCRIHAVFGHHSYRELS